MPILEVVSNVYAYDPDTVQKIKALGSLIGYNDPKRIWVTTRPGLQQEDVAYVLVMVKESDYRHENFGYFCDELAGLLREALNKSVEVILPGGGPMLPMAWAPTKEGAIIYAD